jgi:hypothetical protein
MRREMPSSGTTEARAWSKCHSFHDRWIWSVTRMGRAAVVYQLFDPSMKPSMVSRM